MDLLDQHLPKILDLASNFNIDLSKKLKEFAQELRNDVPGLKDSFSFPKAAIRLQQWTEIYGRKVDYVYSLAVELGESMNSHMNVPQQEELSPKKVLRKKKVVGGTISCEDFCLMTIPLENVKAITKVPVKRRKKHTAEYVSLRLQPSSYCKSSEFHIYDDEFSSIGTKDQFRLNWYLDNKCRLEEFIKDEGSDSSWNVCDVGVINMPTPDYSDEGMAQDVLNNTFLDANDEIGTDDIPETDGMLLSAQTCVPLPVELGPRIDQPNQELIPPEKPVICTKNTFKLPYELTRKGLRGAKPEQNTTLFLFSDMLKRSLKIKGPLPPPSKEKNFDGKLLVKHITFLKNRFHLDVKSINFDGLLEQQPDFLGFEEIILGDEREVLTAIEAEPPVPCTSSEETFDADPAPDPVVYEPGHTSKQKPAVDAEGAAAWREFMTNKLANEKQESDFDVHAYGSRIISAYSHVGETLSFAELAGGIERREVSKLFLSGLMLANTSNISIQEDGLNTLQMTLNSSERHQDMERALVALSNESNSCKRKASNCVVEQPSDKRYRKQIPGTGPWINKSKK